MTRISRTVSFTPEHFTLLDRIARERRMGVSETIRCIVDFALDRDATLSLPFHADRAKSLQGELATVQATIKGLVEQPKTMDFPARVFEEVADSDIAPPRTAFVDRRPGTAEGRWCGKVKIVLGLTSHIPREDLDNVMKTIAEGARSHPEWVDLLEPADRARLGAMIGESA